MTRNRPDALRRCVDSVSRSREKDLEIIVVDDASDLGLPGLDSTSNVKILRNQQRLFLSASRNRGAKYAHGQFIFFLDDDNVVEERSITELRMVLVREPKIMVASPLILYTTLPTTIWFAGGRISPISGLFHANLRGMNVQDVPRLPFFTSVFHDAFMVRARAFDRIGYFDEFRFPMYLSEADWASRMAERGFAALVVPSAKVYHDIEPVLGTGSLLRGVHITEPVRAYFVARNRLLFMRMHRSPIAFLLHVTFFQPLFVATHLFAIISGHRRRKWTHLLGPYVRGLADGLEGGGRHGWNVIPSRLQQFPRKLHW